MSDGTTAHKWYILQAYAGYETRVEKTILEKLRIKQQEEKVSQIFIPSEDVIKTNGGKKEKSTKSIFRVTSSSRWN